MKPINTIRGQNSRSYFYCQTKWQIIVPAVWKEWSSTADLHSVTPTYCTVQSQDHVYTIMNHSDLSRVPWNRPKEAVCPRKEQNGSEVKNKHWTTHVWWEDEGRKEEEEVFLVLRLIVREGDVTRLLHYALRRVNSVLDTWLFRNALSCSGGNI